MAGLRRLTPLFFSSPSLPNSNVFIRPFCKMFQHTTASQHCSAETGHSDNTGNMFHQQVRELELKPLSKDAKLGESWKQIRDLLLDKKGYEDISWSLQWMKKVLDVNVPNGKLLRGNQSVRAFVALVPDAPLRDIWRAHALGWCLEFVQGCFLIYDDIMDGSVTRRGEPCWYLRPEVKQNAVNDGLFLKYCSYGLLEAFLYDHSCFNEIITSVNRVYRLTVLGQCLDSNSLPPGATEIDIDTYTVDKWTTIVKYKTAYYTLVYPIRLALYLANINDPQLHGDAEKILIRIGIFFQAQDDYIDVFIPASDSGKVGTDIIDGKCSWPITRALAKATPEQKEVIRKHYGKKSDESEKTIRNLFEEMKIEQEYKEMEQREGKQIREEIAAFHAKYPNVPEVVFTDYLEKLLNRKK